MEEEDYGFLEFLRSLLASYVESYWVVACSLLNLVGVSMEGGLSTFKFERIMEVEELHKKGIEYWKLSLVMKVETFFTLILCLGFKKVLVGYLAFATCYQLVYF